MDVRYEPQNKSFPFGNCRSTLTTDKNKNTSLGSLDLSRIAREHTSGQGKMLCFVHPTGQGRVMIGLQYTAEICKRARCTRR
jgi:hypothetical protein